MTMLAAGRKALDRLLQIILLVLILMHYTIYELGRVIGKEKLLRIFFGPVPAQTV